MPADGRLAVRLELAAGLEPLASSAHPSHATVREVIRLAVVERLDALRIPGTADVTIAPRGSGAMPVCWRVADRLALFPESLPAAAWAFVRPPLREGATIESNQRWVPALRAAVTSGRPLGEEWLHFFRFFVCGTLEQRPSLLLGADASLPPVVAEVLDAGCIAPSAAEVEAVLSPPKHHREIRIAVETLISGLAAKTIDINVNRSTLRMLSLQNAGQLSFSSMREVLFKELGVAFPRVRFVVSNELRDKAFSFTLNAWPTVPQVGLAADQLMVDVSSENLPRLGLQGTASVRPGTGRPAAIIAAESRAVAESAGLETLNPLQYVAVVLSAHARRRADRFVTSSDVSESLLFLREVFPHLFSGLRDRYPDPHVTRVLRSLVAEGVSVRGMRAIAEDLLEFDYVTCSDVGSTVLDDRMPVTADPTQAWLDDPDTHADFIRTRLKREITYSRAGTPVAVAIVPVYQIEPTLERSIESLGAKAELSSERHEALLAAIEREVQRSESMPALLTSIGARRTLRDLVADRFPDLRVLCHQELVPRSAIQSLGTIST